MKIDLARLLLVLILLFTARSASAIEPQNVYVISNRNSPESVKVAEHYLGMRSIPADHHISLDLPLTEDISRDEYQEKLAKPLRKALVLHKRDAKVLLTVYGVPLRVGTLLPTAEDKAEEERLRGVLKTAQEAKDGKSATESLAKIQALPHTQTVASVDSELMLLWWRDYPLKLWQANPLYFPFPEKHRAFFEPTLMTARLDGPTPEIAMRLVNDAVAIESVGLQGKAYIDARGIRFQPERKGENGIGYQGYDESFRETAELLQRGGLDVTLNNLPEVFPPQSCPDCAIYCGWYSLAKYVPSCRFNKGAVAWHLASSEAQSLRRPGVSFWCPNLLKDGVAVTLGPVGEPYSIGFPKPAEFYGFLATGKYTVVECYARTIMVTSWMTVLIGDPLYNPFAKRPLIKEEDVQTSPKGIAIEFVREEQK